MSSSNGIEPELNSSLVSIDATRSQSLSLTRLFKQAADLFLKRNLEESLLVIEPVIYKPQNGDKLAEHPLDQPLASKQALIVSASRALRIKYWCLYIRIIDELIGVGANEGKKAFGPSRWKELADSARSGSVWQTVVDNGYEGREVDVDAEVVANLATLLLAHMPSQKLTQQRLETYLSTDVAQTLDVMSHMKRTKQFSAPQTNGTSTPRDLNSRLQIIELFVLHVLPRNDEWTQAKEFVALSEVLDDERKDAFLLALQALQDEKRLDEQRQEQLQRQRQQQLEDSNTALSTSTSSPTKHLTTSDYEHPRDSKQHHADYGLSEISEKPPSQNLGASIGGIGNPRSAKTPPENAGAVNKPKKPQAPKFVRRAHLLVSALQNTILGMGQSMRSNPAALFRMLAFMVAVLMAFARQDMRDRVQSLVDAVWMRLKRTIGMGLKVSYV